MRRLAVSDEVAEAVRRFTGSHIDEDWVVRTALRSWMCSQRSLLGDRHKIERERIDGWIAKLDKNSKD